MFFFKTPKFWYRAPNFFLKLFLSPISYIYSYISTKNYQKDFAYTSKKSKVIAVGGITVGGSGKTMVVKEICEILKSRGKKAAILSRGFGRSSEETMLVDSQIHSYKDVGDEPLMLSRSFPVYVGKDRSKSAKLAELENFDFLILDDGISQRYIKPDIKLIIIDEEQWFGNGEMFPLGPNRFNFDKIKSDANYIIVLNKKSNLNANKFSKFDKIPIIEGKVEYDFHKIEGKVIAFCGIGYPEKFFNSLSGFNVIKKIEFPDHYPFSEKDMDKLIAEANTSKAQLVSTEKDLVRIPQKYQQFVTAIPAKVTLLSSIRLLLLIFVYS